MTVLFASKQLTYDVIVDSQSVGVKGFVRKSASPVEFNISRRTIGRHSANMFSRHGTRTALELIRFAHREGIIGVE